MRKLNINNYLQSQKGPYFLDQRVCLFIALSLLFLPFAGCSQQEDLPETPNIIFILADDLGYGDIGVYNPESKIPTPNIDQLATQGLRFMDAHAPASVCVPSRFGLLTGRHPHRVQTGEWRERPLIEPDQTTIASLLGERGYKTYMVGKWHLGFEGGSDYDCSQSLRGGPVDRGFDHYFGIPASLDQPPYFYIRDNQCVTAPTDTTRGNGSETTIWTDIQGAFWRGGDMAPNFSHDEVLPRLTEETLSYLNLHQQKRASEPFFLYMALPAPHTPWVPTDSLRGRSNAGLYGDFVMQVDQVAGSVLAKLDELDMSENTLVIFSSDNGPVWYEKDRQRFNHRSTHIYRGMKSDAWEGGHRVPFILRWPGHAPADSTSDQLLTFTDMLATFADISGAELPENETDGHNLHDVFAGIQESIPREGAVFQAIHYLAVRDSVWKLVPGLGSGGFISEPNTRKPGPGDPKGQLYHLGKDPGEQNNLYSKRPEVVQRLQRQLLQYRQQMPDGTSE